MILVLWRAASFSPTTRPLSAPSATATATYCTTTASFLSPPPLPPVPCLSSPLPPSPSTAAYSLPPLWLPVPLPRWRSRSPCRWRYGPPPWRRPTRSMYARHPRGKGREPLVLDGREGGEGGRGEVRERANGTSLGHSHPPLSPAGRPPLRRQVGDGRRGHPPGWPQRLGTASFWDPPPIAAGARARGGACGYPLPVLLGGPGADRPPAPALVVCVPVPPPLPPPSPPPLWTP